MKEIRLGTIGSGMIVHTILDCVKELENIRLEAVYSRNKEKGEKLAAEYGAVKVYTDMDAFMQDPDVNFVYIASPNLLHYGQARQALLAGKNVICEKPFCTKAEQAKELVALAKEKGLVLVDATPTAFLPNLEVVKRELHKIGRVKLVQSSFCQYSSRYDLLLAGEVPNVFNPEYAGGCLMDINYYNVYLNVTLFGKPQSAVYYPNIYPELVDTSGVMIMQYDGFVGECTGAKDTWGVNTVQIQGEKGYIYIEDGSSGMSKVHVVTKETEEVWNEQPNPNRWAHEMENMVKVLLEEDWEKIGHGLEVMVDVMEVIETSRKEAGIYYPGDSEYPQI